MEVTENTIDIDKILKDKMGDKARYVPGVLTRWLRHIIHQKEVNAFLWEHKDHIGVEWLEDCVKYLDMTLKIEGAENLPDKNDGKLYTFVSNHPLGGIDGVALGAVIGKHYDGNFRYLVNDLLMNLHGLAPLCVPINKTGKQSRDIPRLVEAAFGSDNHIIMFPAGLCSRREKGVIHDLPWNKTFITKSIETQRDVVPIHFGGCNSDRFYRVANIGKRLGLKFNIAMLFLADETFRNRHKTFSVHIGRPIPYQTFQTDKKPAEWARWVEEQVYKLA